MAGNGSNGCQTNGLHHDQGSNSVNVDNGNGKWMSFELPPLRARPYDEQAAVLLLAWALLLHRGSINFEKDSFSWGSADDSKQDISTTPPRRLRAEKLPDIISSEIEAVSKLLASTKALVNDDLNISHREGQTLTFSTADSPIQVRTNSSS